MEGAGDLGSGEDFSGGTVPRSITAEGRGQEAVTEEKIISLLSWEEGITDNSELLPRAQGRPLFPLRFFLSNFVPPPPLLHT